MCHQTTVTRSLRHSSLYVLYISAAVMMLFSGVHCLKPKLRSPYIRDYDIVDYDHVALREHQVTKRSTVLKLQFEAFERQFTIVLRQDTGHIHRDVIIETSSGLHKSPSPLLYSGKVQDYRSSIHGILDKEGHFEGKIVTDNDTFYIEKASHHFDNVTDFHTIMYKQSDVTFNSSGYSCAHEQLFEKQKRFVYDVDKDIPGSKYNKLNGYDENNDSSFLKHLIPMRKRRTIVPTKTVCELYIQADYLFYKKYGSNVDTVIEKISQHVQAANTIYQNIDFDGTGGGDHLTFIIKKIKVWDNLTDDDYTLNGNFGAAGLLDHLSREIHSGYCLSYLFTDRDFANGVIGLAWGGRTHTGGVCDKERNYSDGLCILNTGLVTMTNYGHNLPAAVSHVHFAHVLGHSLGAGHDPENNATGKSGGPNGNFLMFGKATSGVMYNNDKLSEYSIATIQAHLEEKARGPDGCFVEYTGSVCGNREVEDGEECDCGWEEDCVEGCCNPQVTDPTLPGVETPCTRKSRVVCSPSEGACCQDNCQYLDLSEQCRQASDCLDEAYCTGTSAACPVSTHIANGTECGESENRVCYNGECSGSFCLTHGRKPCYCQAPTPDDWSNIILCTVCCFDGDICKPAYELDDVPDKLVQPGTPCNKFQGYCDIFNKCRGVDADGPMNRLKKQPDL